MTPRGCCPACRAAFRSTTHCSRCGADLTPLMTLETAAWRCREGARIAVRQGDFERMLRQASEAQKLCPTPDGEGLRRLAAWLVAERRQEVHAGPEQVLQPFG